MIECKLCLRSRKLVKAHIIPKFFFEFLYPNNNRSVSIISIGKSVFGKRLPVGPYDCNILCEECDSRIGIYDAYAKEIFLDSQITPLLNLIHNFATLEVDYKKMKLFFISLLWRASITKRQEFSRIDAGPFMNKLREFLLSQNPGTVDEFSVIITKFDEGRLASLAKKNILFPYREKIDDINFSIFYLPNAFKIFIKVDERKMPTILSKIALNNGNSLVMPILGKYEDSDEFKEWRNLAQYMPKKYLKN